MKKPWITPQLVLLMRGRPDEAVLIACKSAPNLNNDIAPSTYHGGCHQSLNGTTGSNGVVCDACKALAAS